MKIPTKNLNLERDWGIFIEGEKEPLLTCDSYEDAIECEKLQFKYLRSAGFKTEIRPVEKKE